MTKVDAAHNKLQWHPAFLQAMRAELFEYRDYLEFRHEYPLTAAPLEIDLLIIKKPRELVIDKNIARIFRTDNLLEYKSPKDYLSIKDFWKVCAYANFYAAITPGVDLSDVTLTFVENRHPRKLLEYLTRTRGYTIEETSPGIYRVSGDYIPIQIIESRKLPKDENLWLNSLRDDLKESHLNVIHEEGKKRGREIDIDAYMDVVFRANIDTISEVDKMWQDTLYKILEEKGVVAVVQEEWKVQGREQGLEQGRERTARNLLRMGMPIEDIAEAAELPIEKIRALAAAS
jgi:hypothetical protein